MNLEEYYIKAHSGEKVDNTELLEYINSYKSVVLWGASYLGEAIGKELIKNGVAVNAYWDMRAKELKLVNGIEVKLPFTSIDEDMKNILIVLCIGNTAIMPKLLKRLEDNGYLNILRGDKVFMGLVCQFDKTTGINGEICNGTMTCRSMFCRRLHSIVEKTNDKGGIFLNNLTIMVNTKCSLKCKYCVAYMNSYPTEKKQNVPYEQICKDIDNIFRAVDSIGAITVQGGEPFLHPDIDRIIKKLLEKKNFGIISVATNGIFKIDREKLDIFKDSRLNVAFSGYYGALKEEQMKQFYKNIELMESENVPHTVGVQMAEWLIPPSLWNRNYSKEIMMAKKSACKIPERCLQIYDGKLYPCLYSMSLHGIGIADYSSDYIELEQDNLAWEIKKFMERPYYQSCGHCGGGGSTNMAGEQGIYDFISPEQKGE